MKPRDPLVLRFSAEMKRRRMTYDAVVADLKAQGTPISRRSLLHWTSGEFRPIGLNRTALERWIGARKARGKACGSH